MSIYKKIDRGDTYLSSINSQKSWNISGTGFEDVGIRLYNSASSPDGIQDSIKHLYYSLANEDLENNSSFENYFQSSFDRTLLDHYPTGSITVLSLTNKIIGTHIEPGTFNWEISGLYTGVDKLVDDKEGNIVSNNEIVGNIIYTHGIVTIYSLQNLYTLDTLETSIVQWKSNLPLYTKNIHCKVKNNEFNYTLNKTSHKKDNGTLIDSLKNENFSPYITSIGLYNNRFDLIAIAKLSQPIQKSKFTDTVFDIKLDSVFGLNRTIQTQLGRQVDQYVEIVSYFKEIQGSTSTAYVDEGGYKMFRKSSLKDTEFNTAGVNEVQSYRDNTTPEYIVDVIVHGNRTRGFIYEIIRRTPITQRDPDLDRPDQFYIPILDQYFYGGGVVSTPSEVVAETGQEEYYLTYKKSVNIFGGTVEGDQCTIDLLNEINQE